MFSWGNSRKDAARAPGRDRIATMKFRHSFLRLAALGLLPLMSFSPRLHAETYPVTVEENVPARMRDGITLLADIYRPNTAGKFPVLLQRTPYSKTNEWDGGFFFRAAAQGYVVVVQDVRGRYNSEGTWYPFLHEAQDGYDAVEWAAALPYSDGRVGMFGGSYVGATQMLAATAHPPHLAGISPAITASNYHDGWVYQGGAFEQWFSESWTSGLAQDTLTHAVGNATNARRGEEVLPLTAYPLFNFPAPGAPSTSISALAPYFLDWLAHPAYDDYWKRLAPEERYAEIRVPALHIAAWHDIFLGGTLRNYTGMKASGGTDDARRGQHLVVTIGGHAGDGHKVGDLEFGPEAEKFREYDTILHWYDFLFKGVQNEFSGKRVRIFVMGLNQWRDEDDWPLARAQSTKYFLHSHGAANSSRGDGTLSTANAASEPADKFAYDPAHPVPTVGGPLCCDGEHLAPGPREQKTVEERNDVLIYSTPPLDHDLEVTGSVRLELFASSSAVDTDFTAKLVDVYPDGSAFNLTEGILRARYRNSTATPEPLTPGKVYPLTVDLWATSNLFRAGHRIRLEVSSGNFPRFDRNLNTGESAATSTRWATATNTIVHDAAHPSALVLPVVP
jgi:putative CocE/NonD family hydrolase